MTVERLKDDRALDFMRVLECPECGMRVRFNGEGQAGIWRVMCYVCEDCDVLYQLIIEKHGSPMFKEAGVEGRCSLVPDEEQEKCNVCACGLYSRSDTLD